MKKLLSLKSTVIILILFLMSSIGNSQSFSEKQKKKNYSFLSINYHDGGILPTNDFVKGDNLSGNPLEKYNSVALKYGWQNPGYADWQKNHHAPYYGIGLLAASFNNSSEMGNPVALFGFFGIPIVRIKKFELYSELQFGVSWNQTHYHPDANPSNIAIGSLLTLYVDMGIMATYQISKNIDLGVGLSFTHLSNGGFERPNRGINFYAPSIELKYHFMGKADVKNMEKPEKKKNMSNDLYFMLGYGDHQIVEYEFDTNYYSVAGLGITYSLQHTNCFRSGLGVDFNYLRSLSAKPDGTPGVQGTLDNLTIGFIYAPELIIGNLSIVGGIGIYAKHHKYGNFTQLYQRGGLKYNFSNNFSAGINVRAINFMLAEFLEFNVGYRIRWSG